MAQSANALVEFSIAVLNAEADLNRRIEAAMNEHSRIMIELLEDFRRNQGVHPPILQRQTAQRIRRPLRDITNLVNNEENVMPQ